jgi:hypothetical protein
MSVALKLEFEQLLTLVKQCAPSEKLELVRALEKDSQPDFQNSELQRAQKKNGFPVATDPIGAIQDLLGDVPADFDLADELIAERRRMATHE